MYCFTFGNRSKYRAMISLRLALRDPQAFAQPERPDPVHDAEIHLFRLAPHVARDLPAATPNTFAAVVA